MRVVSVRPYAIAQWFFDFSRTQINPPIEKASAPSGTTQSYNVIVKPPPDA